MKSPAAAGLLLFGFLLSTGYALAQPQADAKRGLYISRAAGCLGCHTEDKQDAQPYAGGRALKTPFGTFFGPNITPHPQAGIGRWGEQDFVRAMREGRRPDGAHYFPAFPYPSFTRIADQDLRDLWAYLRSLPPSSRASEPHDLRFPFGWRWLVWGWKLLFFLPALMLPMPRAARRSTAAAISPTRWGTVASATRRATSWAVPRSAASSPARSLPTAAALPT